MAKSFTQNRWNITKIEGDKFVYDMIYQSLSESNKDILDINELINSLNGKTTTKTTKLVIKYNNRTVTIMKYLKIVHKGIVKFIDDYDKFGILKKNNRIYIKLMEDYLEGWEIINNDF